MVKAEEILLTTKDNPFNPFEDDDDWRAYDTDYSHPHNTEAYVMRVLGMRSPENFDAEDLALELMQVYEEIIKINQEMGIDLYELITPEGKRLDHVPQHLLIQGEKV